ncbi:hypothetical protein B0H67DRAFT_345721 [Lasiosphaeris hirsuta]|uniref:Uncharacterized protein n=1 Tax=Lasiosphaeris hirsuta TaxID=260670 RepID=A0AA40DMI2_9PEZI|nr:hypothetical protein B0H67DRAFT_345721 [Lasiosphaeris hirsuta]
MGLFVWLASSLEAQGNEPRPLTVEGHIWGRRPATTAGQTTLPGRKASSYSSNLGRAQGTMSSDRNPQPPADLDPRPFLKRRTQTAKSSIRSVHSDTRKTRTWATFRSDSSQASTLAAPPKKQQSFPTYLLSWEKLEEYLHKKWPDETFKRHVEADNYVFELPYPGLTADDEREIVKLRGKVRTRSPSNSPERSRRRGVV